MKNRSNTIYATRLARCAAVLMGLAVSHAHAADWPQYLGPTMNSTSTETGLARTWPKDGPKVLWTVPLGLGYGAPAVKDSQVYLLDRVANKKDVLRCLGLADGKEQWTFEYAAPGKLSHDGSRTTPAVDDKHVYTLGPFGHFHCIDRKTHQPVWKRDLLKDFKGKLLHWGFAPNPVLYKNTVITAPQGRRAGVAAFEKNTGKLAWKTPFIPEMAPGGWHGSYVTPVVLTIGGVDQVVFITSPIAPKKPNEKPTTPGKILGFSAADGSPLWSYSGWNCAIAIPCAMSPADDLVFVSGGYDAGVVMLKITKKGNAWTATEVFKTTNCRSQLHPPHRLQEPSLPRKQ